MKLKELRKIKKKLYWDLMFKYIVFLIAAVIATALFLGLTLYVLFSVFSKYSDSVKFFNIPIKNIEYDNRTKELKLSEPIGENAWVEILKDNKVIFFKGNKQDDKMEYTQQELSYIANNVDQFVGTDKLTYEYIPFTGLDGENYTLILKKPKGNIKFRIGFNTPEALKGSDFDKEISKKLNIIFCLFLFIIFIIILLFSRITFKKIIKPMKELNNGLKQVINGDYSVTLDFKGNYEFEEIRDAFNYMTQMLKKAEIENKNIAESKKRLLLDISHDLRTPAATIQGYAEALCNDLVQNEESKKKYLQYIYEKSKHVTDLIGTLFKYSKLESSVYDLNKEVNNICEFLRNVVISFYGELEEKEFDLDIEIPDKKVLFNFDSIELERAFSNIISNIIKYNPKYTTLIVSLIESDDVIQIIIGDNGIGMSENIQKNIFNALVRGDNARKTDGGMGLGLAIAKKIIELHRGNISLQSEVGAGSKFIIDLKKK